jgi:Fe-S-cluster containining protein
MELTVPAGLTPLRGLLPVFQGLANTVVDIAMAHEQQQGKQISCKAGCGACCRQLVPVSAAEAHALARLVEAMPEPRRSTIQARFAAVRERVAAAGLLEMLRHPSQMNVAQRRTMGLEYSHLRIPCPFLEEESCSIYPDRPLVCREYLVTSPAEACGRQDFETIAPVRLPAEVANALRAVDWQSTGTEDAWVPLSLSLDWDAKGQVEPLLPGPAWIEKVFTHLANKPVGVSAQKQEAAGIKQLLQAFFAPATPGQPTLFLRPEATVLEVCQGQAHYLTAAAWTAQRPVPGPEGSTVDILTMEQHTPTLVTAYAVCRKPQRRTHAVFTLIAERGVWRIGTVVLEEQGAG